MRALIDTNILLDLILDRPPFADNAEAIWEAARAGRFEGYVAAISPLNIFYIVRKARGTEQARQAVEAILKAFDVYVLDHTSLQTALTLPLNDYEDAVQLAGAIANGLDSTVTRDPTDFTGALIPVISPSNFLAQLPENN
jgi:predicted nucleic acid-binding protein